MPEQTTIDRRVAKVVEIIDKGLARDLSVNAVACAVDLSQSYLAHIFKLETGVSIGAYVRNRRIAKAARLLIASSLSVKEIAAVVGFLQAQHFTRAFTVAMGCSPTKYRIYETRHPRK